MQFQSHYVVIELYSYCYSTEQWSNYEGARGGLDPLKDRVAPSKHLV